MSPRPESPARKGCRLMAPVACCRTSLVLVCVLLSCGGSAVAQTATSPTKALSDRDRADIRELVAHYQRALSSCASRDYAELFTPDGTFASDDFRGAKHRELYGKSATLVGRQKLMQLVETEEFCLDPALRAARASRAASTRAEPAVTIEATADGARGVIPLAGGGRYEDEYVKTVDGWRFKSRRVFMPPPSGNANGGGATAPRSQN